MSDLGRFPLIVNLYRIISPDPEWRIGDYFDPTQDSSGWLNEHEYAKQKPDSILVCYMTPADLDYSIPPTFLSQEKAAGYDLPVMDMVRLKDDFGYLRFVPRADVIRTRAWDDLEEDTQMELASQFRTEHPELLDRGNRLIGRLGNVDPSEAIFDDIGSPISRNDFPVEYMETSSENVEDQPAQETKNKILGIPEFPFDSPIRSTSETIEEIAETLAGKKRTAPTEDSEDSEEELPWSGVQKRAKKARVDSPIKSDSPPAPESKSRTGPKKVLFPWNFTHRLTIAICIKHFGFSWPSIERVISHLFPGDVQAGNKIPGSKEWVGNIRFQFEYEKNKQKSAKRWDPVEAEVTAVPGQESQEYRNVLQRVVGAMGVLGIQAGVGQAIDFSKKYA